MNRAKLKNYGPQARRDFIQAVTDRAAYYGLTLKKTEAIIEKGDVALIGGRAFPRDVAQKRKSLEERISRHGFEQVMETMAYTWFNRLVAIRFMEMHGYLEHGYRVLSHPEGKAIPEILEHAEHVELPGLHRNKVIDLKLESNKEDELYRLILIAQCNALHSAMPFLFEWVNDETELLLPDNLLHSDSLIRKLINGIDEEDWQEVEIIGWLYQFYISEKKDEVIGMVVRSEDIPAATQLFTPNWIVKYMVQNTLGRQWLATYPNSPLRGKMDFYIEPADQTLEVQTQLKAITPESLNPEEITLLDPAPGSGHILVEAYNLFKEIYQERGYRAKDIPALILQKNLFGLEICDRAAQLAAFALMMKARADDRLIFSSSVQPNILVFQESNGLDTGALANSIALRGALAEQVEYNSEVLPQDIKGLLALFNDAKTFGSLIQVPIELVSKLPDLVQRLHKMLEHGDLIAKATAKNLIPFIKQAQFLAENYNVVVTNPPYMGRGYQNPKLKSFLSNHFDGYEKDLFSAFIIRSRKFAKIHADLGFMSPFVWMFIASHKNLRTHIVDETTLTTLIQLEYSGFAEATVPVCTFTFSNSHIPSYIASFIKLSKFRGPENQGPRTLEAIQNRNCDWFYLAQPDEFKKIPSIPFAYWIPNRIREAFNGQTLVEHTISDGQTKTGDNDRYLRLLWEVEYDNIGIDLKWLLHPKGGPFRRWYGNLEWVIDWSNEARAHYRQDRVARILPEYLWSHRGVCWTLITSGEISFRMVEKNEIFNLAAPTLFPKDDNKLFLYLGFLNSCITTYMLRLLNPTLNSNVGEVQSLPFGRQTEGIEQKINLNVSQCIDIAKTDWNSFETAYEFKLHPFLTDDLAARLIEGSFLNWEKHCIESIKALKRIEEDNNRLFIEAYGLSGELSPEIPEDKITLARPCREEDIKRLISYAIGCMTGRYNLDKPGVVYARSGNKGFDPSQYKTFPADQDGIIPIMEEDWFAGDASNRLVSFIGVAWPKGHLEENLRFIAGSLGSNNREQPRDTIRRYLATAFFRDHLRIYKRRPIYWLFSSGKLRAFQCLVYLHRYNEGTLSRMRTEYVIPLQGKIASRIEQLAGEIQNATSTSHRKKMEKERDTLIKQQAELQSFDEKLRHYADLRISLDLDDGVKVNYGKFGDLLAEVKTVTGGSDE